MASNTGTGGRHGAIKDRFQMFDPTTERWSVFDWAGKLLRTKKSPGPFKSIQQGPPKKPLG